VFAFFAAKQTSKRRDMATNVKTRCPDCGDVNLTPQEVRLFVYPPTKESWSYYSFTCPKCKEEVRVSANEPIRQLLTLGGVEQEEPDVPAEVFEEHNGPVLTHDYVLDFALWLEQADLVAAAAQQTRPNKPDTAEQDRKRGRHKKS
jgi:predicted RNA-binding Zn-ribbon protein involved in translation (DUF1610 family)